LETPSEILPWAIGAGIVAILVAAFIVWRTQKARRKRPEGISTTKFQLDGSASERERLIALSGAIRDALAQRFDATWLAKTTEDLAASPTLASAISADDYVRLLAFLRAVDRLKFSRDGLDSGDPDDQRDMFSALVDWAKSFVAADASSTMTGK
jgi:hypothetical protein